MKSKITKSIVLFFVIVVVIFNLKKEYSIQDKSANGEILASNLGIIGDKLSRKTDDFIESSWEIVSEEETETITKRYEDSVESEGINSCNNPYFPYQGEESLYADGEYYDEDMDLVESGVKLKISFIKAYENGSVYKLSMESLNYYQDYRTHIYLYVTAEQIYRIYAWTMGNEEVISFYNDDEQLKEILDTDEKIIDHADIVCHEEEINEDLEQGEEGRYYTVKKTGDQIVGGYLWIKPNGEIGYYEGFTWKENVGLINYYSGYGAERDIINLNNIGYENI